MTERNSHPGEGSLDKRIREHLGRDVDSMNMEQIREILPETYANVRDMYSDLYDNSDRED